MEIIYPVPIVSAIIEREHSGEIEVLMQTRWKPEKDKKYSGTLEIPAGTLGKHENVYNALKREVLEETGLNVIGFRPDIKTRTYNQKADNSFAFVPFCCQQQTNQLARVGFVFICTVEDKDPVPAPSETKDIHWLKTKELRAILEQTPEKIFTFQLGALDYYLNYNR
jgi:8-oxo-dGTP pyrophosphatase MutT (NUDIX family)